MDFKLDKLNVAVANFNLNTEFQMCQTVGEFALQLLHQDSALIVMQTQNKN